MTAPASPRHVLLHALILASLSTSTLPAEEALPPASTATASEAVRRLTLDEARQLALGNNKSLVLARLNIREKHYVTSAAGKDYFPKLLGSAYYFHFNDNLGKVVTIPSGPLGLLPIGGSTLAASVLNQNSTISTVLVAQPITKLIAVNAAVQIARADEKAAQAQSDKGTRDLLSGVTQAYHGLLGAQRIQAALELQVKLLEQLLALKPVAELRIASVEARQGLVQVRGQVRELMDQLNNLLNLPLCTVLELVEPAPCEPPVRCCGGRRWGRPGEQPRSARGASSPSPRPEPPCKPPGWITFRTWPSSAVTPIRTPPTTSSRTSATSASPPVTRSGIGASERMSAGSARGTSRWRRQNVQVIVDKVQLEARKSYSGFEQARDAYRLAGEMVQAQGGREGRRRAGRRAGQSGNVEGRAGIHEGRNRLPRGARPVDGSDRHGLIRQQTFSQTPRNAGCSRERAMPGTRMRFLAAIGIGLLVPGSYALAQEVLTSQPARLAKGFLGTTPMKRIGSRRRKSRAAR